MRDPLNRRRATLRWEGAPLTLIRRQAAPGGRGPDPRGTAPRTRHKRSRRANAVRVGALAVLLLALAGCSPNDTFTRMGFPNPVTKQGAITLSLWQGSWIAGLLVGAVVWGMILWAVIFHRKRGDKLPPQVRYNMPIEILYTVVPFVLIAVLFYYTAKDENTIDALPANPQVSVDVIGFQWSWEFQYPQYKTGPTTYVTTDGYMWGAGPLPVLEIPVGETVQFNLTSTDVIHSFWVPEFLFKRDVIPDHPNHFSITATQTGTFTGHCSELCGLYHSRMLFTVKIVTAAQFKTWIAHEQAIQTTASGSTQ
jgi:cytochrome c oxidase subunit 2